LARDSSREQCHNYCYCRTSTEDDDQSSTMEDDKRQGLVGGRLPDDTIPADTGRSPGNSVYTGHPTACRPIFFNPALAFTDPKQRATSWKFHPHNFPAVTTTSVRAGRYPIGHIVPDRTDPGSNPISSASSCPTPRGPISPQLAARPSLTWPGSCCSSFSIPAKTT